MRISEKKHRAKRKRAIRRNKLRIKEIEQELKEAKKYAERLKRTCKIKDCNNVDYTKGLCEEHYQASRKR